METRITKYVTLLITKPSSITCDFNKHVNPKIIQWAARHRKIETTLHYNHVSDDMVKEYFEKIENTSINPNVNRKKNNSQIAYY